jgi:hypothetical protein
VDLQGVSEPGLVAPAIGGAVDVHERLGQALTDTLAEHLHARHLLVVLDNCEHLVEASAELVVAGEATFEVTGLPVPRARCFLRQHGRGGGRGAVVRGAGPGGGRGISDP